MSFNWILFYVMPFDLIPFFNVIWLNVTLFFVILLNVVLLSDLLLILIPLNVASPKVVLIICIRTSVVLLNVEAPSAKSAYFHVLDFSFSLTDIVTIMVIVETDHLSLCHFVYLGLKRQRKAVPTNRDKKLKSQNIWAKKLTTISCIIKQVVSKKSSLLLKIQK